MGGVGEGGQEGLLEGMRNEPAGHLRVRERFVE